MHRLETKVSNHFRVYHGEISDSPLLTKRNEPGSGNLVLCRNHRGLLPRGWRKSVVPNRRSRLSFLKIEMYWYWKQVLRLWWSMVRWVCISSVIQSRLLGDDFPHIRNIPKKRPSYNRHSEKRMHLLDNELVTHRHWVVDLERDCTGEFHRERREYLEHSSWFDWSSNRVWKSSKSTEFFFRGRIQR